MVSVSDKPCPLAAAMCICMPFDVMRSAEALERPLDRFLINSHLVREFSVIVRQNADILSTSFDVEDILKVFKFVQASLLCYLWVARNLENYSFESANLLCFK